LDFGASKLRQFASFIGILTAEYLSLERREPIPQIQHDVPLLQIFHLKMLPKIFCRMGYTTAIYCNLAMAGKDQYPRGKGLHNVFVLFAVV
jgi:hypothetical protein